MITAAEPRAFPTLWSASVRTARARARATGRPTLVSITRRIEYVGALAYWAAARACGQAAILWERPRTDEAVVGIGTAHELTSSGSGEASELGRTLRTMVADGVIVTDPLSPSYGPVLLGGFAFDPARSTPWEGYPPGLLVLPTQSLVNRDGESWLTTSAVVEFDRAPYDPAGPDADWSRLLLAARTSHRRWSSVADVVLRDVRPSVEWKAAVERVASEVRAGHAEKVVLARSVRASLSPSDRWVPAALASELVLAHLRASYPSCVTFAFARDDRSPQRIFLGATPERLVSLRDGGVRADCLAGSRPRGASASSDSRLAAELFASSKERAEHMVVVRMLADSLRETCHDVHAASEPTLFRLENVQHLYTPVTATARLDQSVLDLVERLHPTPAVAGWPLPEAMELIRREEGLDRGWYAGPVGWVDASGEGEFNVAIRSALLRGDEATLFAGCGIMGDSEPESEYEESCLKLRPLISALTGAME